MRQRIFLPGILFAVAGGAVCVAMAVMAACSSGGGNGFGGSDSSTGGDSPPPACNGAGALQIHFAPMYSAFITDSTNQTFQVPAIVQGEKGTATWSASDPTAVSFANDPTTGGTVMTVKSATPTVTITAQVGSHCATTTLTITSAVEADWQVGNARYNNGIPVLAGCIDTNVLPLLQDSGINLPPPPDGGCPDAGPACTGCHGPMSTAGIFEGVEHTPEQTAGFSDQDLISIFTTGTVPEGGPYDPNYLPYEYWHLFHTWSDIATPEQQKGMIVYLRSLAPIDEEGGINFGELQDSGILGSD